jgi:hypothetical protein
VLLIDSHLLRRVAAAICGSSMASLLLDFGMTMRIGRPRSQLRDGFVTPQCISERATTRSESQR